MKKVEVPLHKHPLISISRFTLTLCKGCRSSPNDYIYGGYRCNELGCESVFHKDCVEASPEINHSSHPDHPLKLTIQKSKPPRCSLCPARFMVGYCCSICDFKLDLKCARRPTPLFIPKNTYGHEHPLELSHEDQPSWKKCQVCDSKFHNWKHYYRCHQCEFATHLDCVHVGPEAYHTSHPQHPLKKLLTCEPLDYADKKCLLCATEFDRPRVLLQRYHCNVCNFSICGGCMKNPPPLAIFSTKTHEHKLKLVPRCLDFTCNACGTSGDRSPYFCRKCNFMIHRECIDLPRVININRHNHRITYTGRLGHGNWTCGVCRKKVNGFYGAYSCSKCCNFAVHSRCATSKDVWDMIELEGTPEEPEDTAPFEKIDDNTIKHFSHDHNLRINNKDGRILEESILCKACVFQICSESFYSCEQCDYILHEKCANLPLKKRHVCHNQLFTLHKDSHHKAFHCFLCQQKFTGFRYESIKHVILDVRCSSTIEPIMHESHQHPLYYYTKKSKVCSCCEGRANLSCDKCESSLDYKCAILPQEVMRHRYDDHPLSLSYDFNTNKEYWCEACETRVNPSKGFYACNDCGVVLHISCIVGDFSYIMPGSVLRSNEQVVVPNTSIRRPLCSVCNSRCKLPSILKAFKAEGVVDVHFCSFSCFYNQKLNFEE